MLITVDTKAKDVVSGLRKLRARYRRQTFIGRHTRKGVCRQKCFRLQSNQACLDSIEDTDKKAVTSELKVKNE